VVRFFLNHEEEERRLHRAGVGALGATCGSPSLLPAVPVPAPAHSRWPRRRGALPGDGLCTGMCLQIPLCTVVRGDPSESCPGTS